jgi:actin-like ATPase involved in cell morphogenesis
VTYSLAVGLGTAFTRAAIAVNEEPRPLKEGPAPSAVWLVPSAVWLDPSAVWLDSRGGWQAGAAALERAAQSPEAFDPAPLRSVGEGRLLLGGQLVPVAAALGALVRLAVDAARGAEGANPRDVRLTYPVHWRAARRQALEQAARLAELDSVTLIAEPVAAAARLCGRHVKVGDQVGILDFGGASFTASVVCSTGRGLELAAPPVVSDLGGDDIDALIMDHLRSGWPDSHPGWDNLVAPADERWRRAALDLRLAVRRAKEKLSEGVAALVPIPAMETEIQLTKSELEPLMLPVLDQAIDLAQMALDEAGVSAHSLSALYLIGGSSRIPLFADRVWERLGVQPEVPAEPELASVLGAALGVAGRRFETGSRFRGRLAANTASVSWRFVKIAGSGLILSGDGSTVQADDSPAEGPDVASLAAAAETRLAGSGTGYVSMALGPARVLQRYTGLQRRYSIVEDGRRVVHLEWYLHNGSHWIVLSAPEQAREVADRLVLELPQDDPVHPDRFFKLRIAADVPLGWTATERLVLVGARNVRQVVAESHPESVDDSLRRDSEWFTQRFPSPRYAETERHATKFLGGHEAIAVTVRDSFHNSCTRVWSGLIDGRGYRIIATLPWSEHKTFWLLEKDLLELT